MRHSLLKTVTSTSNYFHQEVYPPLGGATAHSTDEIVPYVQNCSVAGCWSLFSSHLFPLLCPRLPGISPTFTILPATKTCNNSNRHRQPNRYFSESLAKTHNPTDSDKSLAKLGGQTVVIVCIGLCFVMLVISPVCYNGFPCHLNIFVKKGQIHFQALTLQIPLLQLYGIWAVLRQITLSVCERVCEWASRACFIQVLNKSACQEAVALSKACCIQNKDLRRLVSSPAS